jgi:hypothetical protein
MITGDVISRSLYKWLLGLFAAVFFVLAINALWAFNFKLTTFDKVSVDSVNSIVSPSLLISEGLIQKRVFDDTIERLSKPLDFMVWPHERKVVSLKLQAVLHERINFNPFDVLLWRRLSFAQAYMGAPVYERAWTIAAGVKLGGWKTSERLLFARHCIAEYDVFKIIIPSLCQRLIQTLPSDRSTFRLARDMGVKRRYLEWLLLHSMTSIESDVHEFDPIEQAQP